MGAPKQLKRDNSQMQTGAKWMVVAWWALIKEFLMELYHSNQNLVEWYGGVLKDMMLLFFCITQANLKY